MIRKNFLILLGVTFLLFLPSLAMADLIPADLFDAKSVPQLTGGSFSPEGGVLYAHTTQTGFRFNAGAAGTSIPADNRRVAYDDVPIPVARLGGFTNVDLTKVTVGIRRLSGAPATDVDVYLTTLSSPVTAPDTEIDIPATLLGTVSLPAATATVTELVSVGNGVTPIAGATAVPLNMTLFPGFGALAIGVRLSSTDTLNGWRLTSGPDSNANIFWIHDPATTGQPNPEGAFFFSNANPPDPLAAFYIEVEGVGVIPEPAGIATMLLGLLALSLRRLY